MWNTCFFASLSDIKTLDTDSRYISWEKMTSNQVFMELCLSFYWPSLWKAWNTQAFHYQIPDTVIFFLTPYCFYTWSSSHQKLELNNQASSVLFKTCHYFWKNKRHASRKQPTTNKWKHISVTHRHKISSS